MKVSEVMRAHVVTTTAAATVHDVVDLMDLYQVRCVPVLDAAKHLVGVVTERDIAGLLLTHCGASDGAGETRDIGRRTVACVMSSPVWAIDDDAEAGEAVRLMLDRGVSRLPVTNGGRVVGIISRIDVCEAALDEPA